MRFKQGFVMGSAVALAIVLSSAGVTSASGSLALLPVSFTSQAAITSTVSTTSSGIGESVCVEKRDDSVVTCGNLGGGGGGSAPASGTWPDASNTGVPAGIVLRPYTGPMRITQAGAVIDGYDIRGSITVAAPDVTIRNSRVTGRIDTGDSNSNPRTLIQRVEIVGPYDSAADGGFAAVGYTGFTCDGCKVRGWGKGFALVEDAIVRNSWVYDIVVHGDPARGGSHNETIISLGGTNLQILNNRLDAGNAPNVSASLALYSQMEAFNNVLVQGNLFDGGGYCVYAGLAGSYGASNTRFIGNTFGTKYGSRCGGYGPATAYHNGNGNVWFGNVMQGSGAAVAMPGR